MQRRDAEIPGADSQPRARRVFTDGLLERGAFGSPKCAPRHREARPATYGQSSAPGRDRACAEPPSRERTRCWSALRIRPPCATARSREVPVPHFVRGRQDTRCDGDPEDGMTRRGLVTPALAGLQAYRDIVDRQGGREGARRGPVAAKQDARRTVFLHIFGGLVDTYSRAQFERRRQGDPELEDARPPRSV